MTVLQLLEEAIFEQIGELPQEELDSGVMCGYCCAGLAHLAQNLVEPFNNRIRVAVTAEVGKVRIAIRMEEE